MSSIFDFLTFGLLLGVFNATEALFQTGWFMESLATQVLVIFIIRTGEPRYAAGQIRSLQEPRSPLRLFGIMLPYTRSAVRFGFVRCHWLFSRLWVRWFFAILCSLRA